MACAPGIAQNGVARQLNGVGITACDGADCCCDVCYLEYIPCDGEGDSVYVWCDAECQDGGDPDVIIHDGKCYNKLNDIPQTPPDGARKILSPNCVGSCAEDVCNTCFFVGDPCPTNNPDPPVALLPCDAFDALPPDKICVVLAGPEDVCWTFRRDGPVLSQCPPGADCYVFPSIDDPKEVCCDEGCDGPNECAQEDCTFVGATGWAEFLTDGGVTPTQTICCQDLLKGPRPISVVGASHEENYTCFSNLCCNNDPCDCQGMTSAIVDLTASSPQPGTVTFTRQVLDFSLNCSQCQVTDQDEDMDSETINNCFTTQNGCFPGSPSDPCFGPGVYDIPGFSTNHLCRELDVTTYYQTCNQLLIAFRWDGYDNYPGCPECSIHSRFKTGFIFAHFAPGDEVCDSGCNGGPSLIGIAPGGGGANFDPSTGPTMEDIANAA